MITLPISGVEFNRENHTYTYDGIQLSGITTLIKNRLFPDKYADVPDAVLKKAAERGTQIHELVELYDSIGYVSDHPELTDYINICDQNKLQFLASEYIVTDKTRYASGIDKIYQLSDNEVILADIKTTYTLDREYVRWQLSIYKYLFEHQTGLKVAKTYAIWLKEGKSALVEVAPYDTELVEKLLYTDEPMIESSPIAHELDMVEIVTQYNYWKKKYDELGKMMKEEMLASGDTTKQGELIRFSLSAPSLTKKFNEKKFAADSPEVYKAYLEEKEVAQRLTIKVLEK